MGVKALQDDRPVEAWVADLAVDLSPAQRKTLQKLASRMAAPAPTRRKTTARMRAEGLADEWNPPDFLTRFITKLFMVDVKDFFFDPSRRKKMQDCLRARLETGGGPFIVVGHSQGTMVAYSLLHELDPRDLSVELFLTIGSPLGMEEVRDQMTKMGIPGQPGHLPVPPCVRRWVNVLDPKDPVTQGIELARYYHANIGVEDFRVQNPDRPRDPHSATGYLSLPITRKQVRDRVDLERFQRVSPFVIAADVVADHERGPHEIRKPLLIELTDPAWALRRQREDRDTPVRIDSSSAEVNLADMSAKVIELIRGIVPKGTPADALKLQRLKRYVSVCLTRSETEKLSQSPAFTEMGLTVPPFYRVWRNSKKYGLLEQSIHTVQASAAHQAYEAEGQGIEWAILDSGCTVHPHFRKYSNLNVRWDCTKTTDEPVAHGTALPHGESPADADDHYGHGTHVAGIIAGRSTFSQGGREPRVISGMAPRARLHIYKVLDDQGEGEDGWIIKAINHIAEVNERAGAPVIAGVNLSLGGPYEQGVFGCGFTPLCEELRRLWRQGVLVVLAAGNEGHVTLMSSDGELEANMAYSINDPANLDMAIAVGAIHKERPHTYGVSHFSSRGPTVDGRGKPDLVAPGEQILSCHHTPPKGATQVRQLFIKLDGTSMAAPHVSGILAAFLSRRREFIGAPDRVKEILLANCTDLGRDRLLQGAGMPNLVRMLVQT
jgi:pimeloyl-ACP methyl ester carboxylesterase